ncbi:unnamed protein product, partial [Rotaria sp. Silwood1]
VCSALMSGKYANNIASDPNIGPTKEDDKFIIDWTFLIDTLNFSFWTDDKENESYVRKYKDKIYCGSFALAVSINQALDDGIDILNAEYYSRITMDELENIFRSSVNSSRLPMLTERLNVLHETGAILLKEYGGHFSNCIEQSGGSALKLVELIVKSFPAYRDEAIYDGQRVSFYKRAQLLVSDIWKRLHGHGLGHFIDIDSLTMFADYSVPQLLSYEGVLVYSPELKRRIDGKEEIPPGDSDECEIRAGSILVVDLIVNHANEIIRLEKNSENEGKKLNAATVDGYLWRKSVDQEHLYQQTPFHRTRTIFY